MIVSASALTSIPPPKGAGTDARLRSVLCQKQHSPTTLVSITRNYFFQIGCGARKATRQQVMPDDHSESVPPLPIPNRTVKRLHADDSADSRVKVGNRQAPQQQQNPHPKKVGFLRLRTPEIPAGTPLTPCRSAARSRNPSAPDTHGPR